MTLPFLWLACLLGVLITTAASLLYAGRSGRSAAPAFFSGITLLPVALWTTIGTVAFNTLPGWSPARHNAAIYAWTMVVGFTLIGVLLVFTQKFTERIAAWYRRHDEMAPFLFIFAVLAISAVPVALSINQAVPNKNAIATATVGVAKSSTYLASPGEIPTAHQVAAGVSRFNYNSTSYVPASAKEATHTTQSASYTISVSGDTLKRCLTFSTKGWNSASGVCN